MDPHKNIDVDDNYMSCDNISKESTLSEVIVLILTITTSWGPKTSGEGNVCITTEWIYKSTFMGNVASLLTHSSGRNIVLASS